MEKYAVDYRFHLGDDLDEFPPIRGTDQTGYHGVYGLNS